MVLNIAAFCEEPIRSELIKAAKIRTAALDIAYNIKGYKEAPLDTKNFIYDAINKALSAAFCENFTLSAFCSKCRERIP